MKLEIVMPDDILERLERTIERHLLPGTQVKFVSRRLSSNERHAAFVEATVSRIDGADLNALGEELNGRFLCTSDETGHLATAELDGVFETVKCHVKLIKHVATPDAGKQ